MKFLCKNKYRIFKPVETSIRMEKNIGDEPTQGIICINLETPQ
jgi:hypothetical protein